MLYMMFCTAITFSTLIVVGYQIQQSGFVIFFTLFFYQKLNWPNNIIKGPKDKYNHTILYSTNLMYSHFVLIKHFAILNQKKEKSPISAHLFLKIMYNENSNSSISCRKICFPFLTDYLDQSVDHLYSCSQINVLNSISRLFLL